MASNYIATDIQKAANVFYINADATSMNLTARKITAKKIKINPSSPPHRKALI